MIVRRKTRQHVLIFPPA